MKNSLRRENIPRKDHLSDDRGARVSNNNSSPRSRDSRNGMPNKNRRGVMTYALTSSQNPSRNTPGTVWTSHWKEEDDFMIQQRALHLERVERDAKKERDALEVSQSVVVFDKSDEAKVGQVSP